MSKAYRKSLLRYNSYKKAQGLSLNTIIIAIIVLVVLVVLVMIFTGYFGRVFTPSVSSCSTQGGTCVKEKTNCVGAFDGQEGKYVITKDCKDTDQKDEAGVIENPNGVCCLQGQ